MRNVKVYTREGGSPDKDELAAALVAVTVFRDKAVGVFPYTHNGIGVEYHPHKLIAYVQGNSSIYFGANEAVGMRCKCRGVVLAEAGVGTDSHRSAAFLTDGTELVSAPIVKSVIQNPPYGIYTESNRFPYTSWLGGPQQPLYLRNVQGGDSKYILSGQMPFEIPDDACAPFVVSGNGFYHLGDDNQTVYLITRDNSVPSLSDVGYGGYYSKQYNGVVNQETQTSVLIGIVNNQIKPALKREHKRRKKCSDGQMAYLRNGFMSPEIERFVKAYHPVSNLLRRDIPMQIISEPVHTLVNEERDAEGGRIASTYECKLTLKYVIGVTEHQKEFVGQVRFTEYNATYTNYPLLGSFLNGAATPVYSEFRASYDRIHLETMYWIYRSAELGIVHDAHSDYSSLFCEVNGTITYNERWLDYYYEGGPIPGTGYYPGEEVKTSYENLTLSSPQFLLDYIAASKPIESELDVNGNKAPVTPSTDWLSSRLTDKEVIRVVPLNHVGNSYGNYGMFPLMQKDAENNLIVNELRIYGYAEFQYNADTSSFTFKKWVELTSDGKVSISFDDEHTLDDESNPSLITITSNGTATSYNLAPKSFEYDPEWGSSNCVCIGNKAIWSDVKAAAKQQKVNISDAVPEGYELTSEERLYHEVSKAVR